MNAVSNIEINFPEDNLGGSDTDTSPDESPEYYEPISNGADSSDENSDNDHDYEPNFHRLPNGCIENGIDSLDLNDEEDEEENERMREALAERAFNEDESRRRAPLTEENAMRVMEAMRGISFGGSAPDWVGQVPEDRWIDQLANIRHTPSTASSS
ncbi:hypothetical protein CTI12_AA195000 [Artemisia annua]|uniref:Uncharacterized protein n=1 Tax=Artemisia annua TaxID=35608 RepID=A0A2U1P4Q7_ARTAN|nr:hypothetical protein CTI12_AA195000 [Artemisia annua]